ncbi:MAG: NUDIX hydrolase [Candidatus Aenigmarchaeota archaeon]|nr:NUDIX hydrolase [Candidatus Aenigmarchaeota archaeon]
MKFFIGVKALIKNVENEILILKSGPWELESTKRKETFWDLPGGKIRKGEQVEQTVKREISEELGIDKNQLEILELFDASISNFRFSHGQDVPLMLVTFLCKFVNIPKNFKLTLEHADYKWASLNEAKNLLAEKFNKTFIDKLSNLP